MLFFVVILFYFSYLRKIIKIYNGATEGLVQQQLHNTQGFSGIIVSQDLHVKPKILGLRILMHRVAAKRYMIPMSNTER
jgi:hypothetical protein